MNRIVKWFFLIVIWIWAAAGSVLTVSATEIIIPEIKTKPGETITVPIMIDEVDNLAGIKIVMKYNKEVLIYKKADKTAASSSLIHIVNDKKPGILIAVMAGARGIKGKNFSILNMTFEVNKELKKSVTEKIDIGEVQLMSDQLKNLDYSVKSNPILVEVEETKPAESGLTEKTDDTPKSPEKPAVVEKEEMAGHSDQTEKPADPQKAESAPQNGCHQQKVLKEPTPDQPPSE